MNVKRIRNRGVSLVELLVVVGASVVLCGLLAPAVLACRESARRATCLNRVRQVGLGFQAYVAAARRYPDNGVVPWPVAIAAYVENVPLYERFDRTVDAFTSPANALLGQERFALTACPSDEERLVAPWSWQASNLVLNDEFAAATPAACVDGLAFTVLTFETTTAHELPWIVGPQTAPTLLDSPHNVVAHVLWGDGSVDSVRRDIDPSLLLACGTLSGGESAFPRVNAK